MLPPGTRLGTYEILSPLGAGGMAEVYRARDLRLGREVAIKVLPDELPSSPERLARFEREARMVAALNHPNIVTLHSVEDHDGVRFLTMELIVGKTLDRLIVAGGLPLPRVLELAIPLVEALGAAHERGVIHRDLKPGNVMVTREGRVKVLDFGLAKLAAEQARGESGPISPASGTPVPAPIEPRSSAPEEPHSSAGSEPPISGHGQVLGTVPYMAPEQIRGEPVDARTDLFALGIILYQLATGRLPFRGATAEAISSAILRDIPQPPQNVRPDLPEVFGRIVSRCLEKDAGARFQSATVLRNELRHLGQTLDHGATVPLAPPATASIAVIPFVNLSRDEEDSYFSDGLADELISMLAKIPGLRVAARTSSFRFRGNEFATADVGRALHVATVLEGSVRKSGNLMRISVQLVKVADGYHLWSQTYDRTLEDIFAVQDDIAHAVVKELRTTLLGEEADSSASREARADVDRAARGRGTNPEAHRLYIQARHFIERGSREDMTKGIEYLKKAVELDPQHALAWTQLGRTYSRETDLGWVEPSVGFGRAREAVERALSLEPDLAEGHADLGWIQMQYDRDWRGADASFRRAQERAGGNSLVSRNAAALSQNLGRIEEAISLYRRAVEHDPLSSASYSGLGNALQRAGRLAESEAAYRNALEISPRRVFVRAALALVVLEQGRSEEALGEALREPEEWARLWALAIIHHAAGRRAESDEALRTLIAIGSETTAIQIAQVHAMREEADSAFEWLERAYALRDPGVAEVKSTTRYRALHGDPRWGAFLRKMRLEE